MSPRTRRLLAALEGQHGVRVPLDAVLAAWALAVPELVGDARQLAELAAAVDQLAEFGALRLPAAGSWDRRVRPPLPLFVTLSKERRSVEAPWRTVAWRPELGWVASLATLTSAQFDALRSINAWFGRAGSSAVVVPARLRSAELFGDEKYLDQLAASALFGPGRLSFDLLRCARLAPPMASRRVGSGPDVLVVENADPYWALCDVLEGASSRIGVVAWGSGKAVLRTITGLWEQGSPGNVWYWGDMDPEGVAIAVSAAHAAVSVGPLRPHRGLWEAMWSMEPTGSDSWERVDASAWFGSWWGASAALRARGGRVAQERVSVATLAAAVERVS